jgi:hypothetical protein
VAVGKFQLVRWADSFTGMHLNTFFDAEGNRVHAFTDTGYDPLGQFRPSRLRRLWASWWIWFCAFTLLTLRAKMQVAACCGSIAVAA